MIQASEVRELVLLPTAQYDLNNPWLPNDRGILRIEAAVKTLEEHPDAFLAIIGGWGNHDFISLSDRMAFYLSEHHPQVMPRLLMVSGLFNRTVDDIFQGMLRLLSFVQLKGKRMYPFEVETFFCSALPHYDRCVRAMATTGFKPVHVESGEDLTIYGPTDDKIAKEDIPGKAVGLGPEGVTWYLNSFKGADEQLDYCRKWARENPEEDRIYFERIAVFLHNLSGQGVLVDSPLFPKLLLPIPELLPPRV